jgi:hypothetical protein
MPAESLLFRPCSPERNSVWQDGFRKALLCSVDSKRGTGSRSIPSMPVPERLFEHIEPFTATRKVWPMLYDSHFIFPANSTFEGRTFCRNSALPVHAGRSRSFAPPPWILLARPCALLFATIHNWAIGHCRCALQAVIRRSAILRTRVQLAHARTNAPVMTSIHIQHYDFMSKQRPATVSVWTPLCWTQTPLSRRSAYWTSMS